MDCRQVCLQKADKVVRVEKCTSSVQRIVVRCAHTFRLVHFLSHPLTTHTLNMSLIFSLTQSLRLTSHFQHVSILVNYTYSVNTSFPEHLTCISHPHVSAPYVTISTNTLSKKSHILSHLHSWHYLLPLLHQRFLTRHPPLISRPIAAVHPYIIKFSRACMKPQPP